MTVSDLITIDGSRGEGGGQILRTALQLACATHQPTQIDNIRAGRHKPGLMRQHLTAVRAAAQAFGADLSGDVLKSQSVRLSPGPVVTGEHRHAVGTAGSAVLVAQTVAVPALLFGDTTIDVTGGTHNDMAPPADFLQRAWLPLMRHIGGDIDVEMHERGFYPAGGGHLTITVRKPGTWRPLVLLEPGAQVAIRATAIVSHLPDRIARRELDRLAELLALDEAEVLVDDGRGPGNVLVVEVESTHVTEVFTAFGRRGVSAEEVAEDAAAQVADYLDRGAAVGPHLADQLLTPLALTGGGSFTTGPLTPHTLSNIEVIQAFIEPDTVRIDDDGDVVTVRVRGMLS